MNAIWRCERGEGPLVAAAVHDGHLVRESLLPLMALSAQDRLREEDPFTANWTPVAPTRIVGTHSRFQVDLNRPREKAVYMRPEDAWGLQVWKHPLANSELNESLSEYDAFYQFVEQLFTEVEEKYGKFVVFDIHTYNHLRNGPNGAEADPQTHPQVNIGTGTMDRDYWAPVVDAFIDALRSFEFSTGKLDVRENIKFQGGNFPRWIHSRFPRTGCAIAIEFKKFFMNEWTGEANETLIAEIKEALASTVSPVLAAI